MTTLEKLAAIAQRIGWGTIDLEDDTFSHTTKVHDWRNHIDSELIELWPELSRDTRLALFINAWNDARNENWD